MIYRILLLQIFLIAGSLAQDNPAKLAFSEHESAEYTKYDLVLKSDEVQKIVWSKVIPKINGREPYAWCNLVVWDRNAQGIVAVIEKNEFVVIVLQADSDGNDSSSFERRDPGWLKEMRRGARLRAEAPNRIIVESSGGLKPKVYSIVDGKILDEDGAEVDPLFASKVGQENVPTPQNPPETNDAPKGTVTPVTSQLSKVPDLKSSLPRENQNRFILSALAGIFVIVAIGLVIFLLKRRAH